jgi:hypothetical protein
MSVYACVQQKNDIKKLFHPIYYITKEEKAKQENSNINGKEN